MVKKRTIKYSDSKFNSYKGLNRVAHKFIQSTGGFTLEFTRYNIQEKDYLRFLISKNVALGTIVVGVRYGGQFVCQFNCSSQGVWLGYRDYGVFDSENPRIKKLTNIELSKDLAKSLNRYVKELLSYTPGEGVRTLEVSIESCQITVAKRDEYGSLIEVAQSEFYVNGR